MASYTDTSGLEAPSQSHPRYDHPWVSDSNFSLPQYTLIIILRYQLSDLAGNPNQDGDSWVSLFIYYTHRPTHR